MKLSHISAGLLSLGLAVSSAGAQTSWSLGSFGSPGASAPADGACRYNNTSVGNIGTCDATGSATDKLYIRGYSFTNSTSSAVVNAGTLNEWGSSGIGMCNVGEASACDSPNHAVDNYNTYKDFIVLQTTSALTLKSVSFGWTNGDADFSVLRYTGALDPFIALNGGAATAASMLSGGWSMVATVDGSGAGTYNAFNAGNLSSQYWIIATHNPTAFGGSCPTVNQWNPNPALDCGDDAFKINGIAGSLGSPGTSTVTPEPSTYVLMAAGLAGLFGVARRRRTNA